MTTINRSGKSITGPIPAVPDDVQERRSAIEKSLNGLLDAREKVARVEELVASVKDSQRRIFA